MDPRSGAGKGLHFRLKFLMTMSPVTNHETHIDGYAGPRYPHLPIAGKRGLTVHLSSDISSGANETPTNAFHETRNTKHETRDTAFSRVLRPSGGEKCRLVPPRPSADQSQQKKPLCAFCPTSSAPSHRPLFDLSAARIMMGFHISSPCLKSRGRRGGLLRSLGAK